MKVLIAVPTYKRPYVLKKRVLYWLNEITEADVKVFCCKSEQIYYEQVCGGMTEVGATQSGSDGLIKQLMFIQKYAVDNGYDIVWKVDDKMRFKKQGVKMHDSSTYINKLIKTVKQRFKKNKDLDLVTVCKPLDYRYSKEKTGFKKRNTVCAGNYFVRSKRMMFNKNVFALDELQLYLHLTSTGTKTMETCFDMYMDNPMGQFQGGLQFFDRLKLSQETYKYLVKQYPLLKLKENDNAKQSIDIGNLIDYSAYKKMMLQT